MSRHPDDICTNPTCTLPRSACERTTIDCCTKCSHRANNADALPPLRPAVLSGMRWRVFKADGYWWGAQVDARGTHRGVRRFDTLKEAANYPYESSST